MATRYDVIVIGAGAAGSIAALELSAAGHRVCVVEAAACSGGRIATVDLQPGMRVETGAEFIHGDLPLTKKLLKQAGIGFTAVEGEMISVHNGQWNAEYAHAAHWGTMMKKLSRLKQDMTIQSFLDNHFGEKVYTHLREAVTGFASGFDLADPATASVISVRDEWEHEDETQYRVNGGYQQLIDWLLHSSVVKGAVVKYNWPVVEVIHSRAGVTLRSATGAALQAAKVIVTASIGMLQSDRISFQPQLLEHREAIRQIGFGSVIKFQLLFKTAFWRGRDIGFLISNEQVPTWWTQLPSDSPLLTRWLGGLPAARLSHASKPALLAKALHSVASIFSMNIAQLKKELTGSRIDIWEKAPFVLGGYSYHTLFTAKAIEILSQPVNDSVYFAGEAVYTGDAKGTVEAALQSGRQVARQLTKNIR